jgi:hypothetical protein
VAQIGKQFTFYGSRRFIIVYEYALLDCNAEVRRQINVSDEHIVVIIKIEESSKKPVAAGVKLILP